VGLPWVWLKFNHVPVIRASAGLSVIGHTRQPRLLRILDDCAAYSFSLHAVYPNRQCLPLKVCSFIDLLVEYVGTRPYWSLENGA